MHDAKKPLIFSVFVGLVGTSILSSPAWADVVNLDRVAFERVLNDFEISDSTIDSEGNTYLAGYVIGRYAPMAVGGIGTPDYGKIGVAKLDSNGQLVFTYYTDSNAFRPLGSFHPNIVVDNEGNIIVALSTSATDIPTFNAAYPNNSGRDDIFLFKIDASGNLIFSTYFGSSSSDKHQWYDFRNQPVLTCDSKGNIYIGGSIYFIGDVRDFPLTNPLWSDLSENGKVAFLAKFSSQGQVLFSTVLPPRTKDISALAVDHDDNLLIGAELVVGQEVCANLGIYSPLPVVDLTPDRSDDLMVAKISGANYRTLWCTQLGGFSGQGISDLIIDQVDNVIIAGTTSSKNFPVYNAYQGILGGPERDDLDSTGGSDAFLVKFDTQGNLIFSTYFGGRGIPGEAFDDEDNGGKLTVDSSGNIYLSGSARSTSFPIIDPFDISLGLNTNYQESEEYSYLALFSPEGQLIRSSRLGINAGTEVWRINIYQDERLDLILTNRSNSFDNPFAWITGTGTLYCHEDAPDYLCDTIDGIPNLVALGAANTNPATYSLTVIKTGEGEVTSNPAGINCGSTCSASFSSDALVALTANANSGYSFSGWSGACSGNNTTCTVTMSAAKSVTATFGSSDSATTLITHYYVSILERGPEADGLAFWKDQIADRQAQGIDVKPVFRDMANFFFNSAEYLGRNTTDRQFITNLYLTFFQREPDDGGYTFWLGKLASGMTRNQAMTGFLNSPEFTNFMQDLGF